MITKISNRPWLAGLMLLALSQSGPSVPIPEGAKLESVTDLGSGFQEVHVSFPDTSGNGPHGFVYQTYLHYLDQNLGVPRECSVSPAGNYVIFQDGPTGNLFLYRRGDGRRAQLTQFKPTESVPTVVKFVWHEENTVDWQYGTEFRRIPEVMEEVQGP